MFGMDSSKTQGKPIPSPENLGEDVIVSPDTRRQNRIPPRQSRTLKWPVLDASGAPNINLATWRFSIEGRSRKTALYAIVHSIAECQLWNAKLKSESQAKHPSRTNPKQIRISKIKIS